MAEPEEPIRVDDELVLPDEPIGQSWAELFRDGYQNPDWDEWGDESDEEPSPSMIEELRRRLG